jgi:hypothetical protein
MNFIDYRDNFKEYLGKGKFRKFVVESDYDMIENAARLEASIRFIFNEFFDKIKAGQDRVINRIKVEDMLDSLDVSDQC